MRKFDKDSNSSAKMFVKHDLQRVLKELKQQGATVEKNEAGGYDVLFGDDMLLQVVIDSDSLAEA
jgi:biotin operon repressor